jgi:hypothetical protein
MAGAPLYQSNSTLDPPTKRSDTAVYVKVVYNENGGGSRRWRMLSVQGAFPFQISFVSDDRNDRTAGTTGKLE